MTDEDSDNEIEEVNDLEGVDIGGSSSQPSGSEINRGLRRSMTMREAEILARGIDPYIFPTKQQSIKSMFSTENIKKVRKSMTKFFHYNAIPFNVAGSGLYYQVMINTIAEAARV